MRIVRRIQHATRASVAVRRRALQLAVATPPVVRLVSFVARDSVLARNKPAFAMMNAAALAKNVSSQPVKIANQPETVLEFAKPLTCVPKSDAKEARFASKANVFVHPAGKLAASMGLVVPRASSVTRTMDCVAAAEEAVSRAVTRVVNETKPAFRTLRPGSRIVVELKNHVTPFNATAGLFVLTKATELVYALKHHDHHAVADKMQFAVPLTKDA